MVFFYDVNWKKNAQQRNPSVPGEVPSVIADIDLPQGIPSSFKALKIAQR